MTNDTSGSEPRSPSRHQTASSSPSTALAIPSGQTSASGGSWLDRLLGWFKPVGNGTDLRTDLVDALAQDDAPDADFSPEERAMLRNILRLRETRTEDVMVPRADIDAVDQATPLGAVLAELRQSGHSRMPVFDGSLDQPVGMVHLKDVVSFLIDQAQSHATTERQRARARKAAAAAKARADSDPAIDARSALASSAGFDLTAIDLETRLADTGIVRPLLFVPASMSSSDLMAQMQANRVQMALVIDEYGGTDGLISLEDLLETVVGDIEDEHDDEVAPIFEARGDGGYVADARVPIEKVQEAFGDGFEIEEDDAEEIDTLGGLVFTALGRIPVRGELIDAVEGLDIEVMDADPRRIKRLKVYPAGLRRRDPRARRTGRTAQAASGGAPSSAAQPAPNQTVSQSDATADRTADGATK